MQSSSLIPVYTIHGPRQANLVLIAYVSSEGSGEPAHSRSLARTSAARSYKQWVKLVGWLCWGLTSQSTIFQSCRDGAIASWVSNQYFRGVKCLAQGHNTAAVSFEPRTSRSEVRHSTTEPPRSPAVSQEEPSDRKPDPWPLWMAGHAQLKFVMTECSKTQIRLTGLTYNHWPMSIPSFKFVGLTVPDKSVRKKFNVWKLERMKNEGIKEQISSRSLILVYTIHIPTVHVCTKFQLHSPHSSWEKCDENV